MKQSYKFDNFAMPKIQLVEKVTIDRSTLVRKLAKIANLKHVSILTLTYVLGLRVSELLNIKIENIDFENQKIIIKNDNGDINRISPISNHTTALLRKYIQCYNPTIYLFNGQSSPKYSPKSCGNIVTKYLGDEYSMNTLRNSIAVDLYVNGTNLKHIQRHLGLKSMKLTKGFVKKVKDNPILLNLPL